MDVPPKAERERRAPPSLSRRPIAQARTGTMTLTEEETRQRRIDAQLGQAGWGLDERSVVQEFALGLREDGSDAHGDTRGFVDYVLAGVHGRPLAVVKAKRTSRDPLAGKRQAANYADRIASKFGVDPFVFLANGREVLFWDRDRYPPRPVSGFFTREDLERLLHQRRYATALARVELNPAIAGRPYQSEAIRRLTEAIDAARRSFLLVMATGTGKTRTAISLMDALFRARRAQRVLFLADRRALVRQAMTAIREHLPHESLGRVEGGDVPSGARIHVATYPSMMRSYSSLSPGYYDLIVADESHRSIYNRYKSLFDHFDALQLGLTATPTDFIDHNTFDLFGCEDGVPTFNYSYEQAVAEGYLVPYRVLNARTSFQIGGIHGETLPAGLQRQLREQGIDLEDLDFEGTDIERTVTNVGTTDALVRELLRICRKDALGLPAKSIVFAISHDHAKRLYQSFNKLFPDFQRRGLAEIIDSHMERAEEPLDDFKFKDMPRIAIAVDMLDTGIDVPAIRSLMFAKPVFSRVKFWQMIGRGTRLYEDPRTGDPQDGLSRHRLLEQLRILPAESRRRDRAAHRAPAGAPVPAAPPKTVAAAAFPSPGSADRQGSAGHGRPNSPGQRQCQSAPNGDREARQTMAGAGAGNGTASQPDDCAAAASGLDRLPAGAPIPHHLRADCARLAVRRPGRGGRISRKRPQSGREPCRHYR